MSLSKKLDLKRDFEADVYLPESQIPIPPHPYTLYVACIQYTYSHREGGEGKRVEPERRGEGQQGRVQITQLC
jgi:hypothetical protein